MLTVEHHGCLTLKELMSIGVDASVSSATMTVATDDITLVDLGLDRLPGVAVTNQIGHHGLFVPQVVELKNHQVRLAAIDTPLRAEVFDERSLRCL